MYSEIGVKNLIRDSKDNCNWDHALCGYILTIYTIPNTEFIWVITSEKNVYLLHTENGKIIHAFENIAELIFTSVKQPNTQELFLGTNNGIFALNTEGKIKHILKENNWFEHLAFSLDGKVLFVAKGKTLYLFEQENEEYCLVKQDSSFNSTISDIIFKHGSFLVANYGGIREYKPNDAYNYSLFEWKTSLLLTSWSTDKKYIATATQENAVHFWTYPFIENNDFQISGFENKITKMLWNKDASLFIVNSGEDIDLWDFSDGPPTGKQPINLRCGNGKICDIYFDENLLIAASENGFIYFFLPDESNRLVQICAIEEKISCIAVNEDETELLVGSSSGKIYSFDIAI
jgi:WD40 repeat protein